MANCFSILAWEITQTKEPGHVKVSHSVHGILQVRLQEWVVIPFSRGSSQHRNLTQVSPIAGGYLPAEPQPWTCGSWEIPWTCWLQSTQFQRV